MNMAWATEGIRVLLLKKLATGSPPYLYTSRPSSRGTGANMASTGREVGGRSEVMTDSIGEQHTSDEGVDAQPIDKVVVSFL